MSPRGALITALALASRGASGAAPREAIAWLYAPTATPATWTAWHAAVAAHPGALTGVAPCLYVVGADGALALQVNASAAAGARAATAAFAALGAPAEPLLAASGTGMNRIIGNASLAAALVAATVAEADALGLSGFNLQLEEPGSAAIAAAWLAFLRDWLRALAPRRITVIIGGTCRGADWMDVSCAGYAALAAAEPNLHLVAEATYASDPRAWREALASLAAGAPPPLLALGMTFAAPLLDAAAGCLATAADKGVQRLYFWVGLPPSEAAWAAVATWTSGAPLPPPPPPPPPPPRRNNTVAFIEPDFAADAAFFAAVRARAAAHGGDAFQVLSLVAWNGSFSPTPSAPLPPPDANVTAFLHAARVAAPRPLRVWGGVALCPGREFDCMLNYTHSTFTGAALGAAARAAGLDGVQIYVSPYCNNANCERTTGKYAVGIKAIITAFRAAAPGLEIALLANEWDNVQIFAAAGPAAVFSYQTVFYFDSTADCVRDAGALCGAGENVAYINKAGRNFTALLAELDARGISWLGMLKGASTGDAENPPDYWPALDAYAAPRAAAAAPRAPPRAYLSLAAIGDWGGQDEPPFTRPGQVAAAAGLARAAGALDISGVLALGDNFYALGLCNNATLAPYNDTCPSRFDPASGTVDDARFAQTFEAVYDADALANIPWYVIAGNQDALGNVSASIAYSARSRRWRHPHYWHAVSAPLWAGAPHAARIDVLMIDTTLCYGIAVDAWHTAMCAAQLAWLDSELALRDDAAFLFVAGHYPIFSACAHGNTQWAIDALLPRLRAARATGYMSGHDHCAEFLDTRPADGLVFVVSGNGDGCCYDASNAASVPAASLSFILSGDRNPANATGGFAVLTAAEDGATPTLSVSFMDQDGAPLWAAPPLRARGAWAEAE